MAYELTPLGERALSDWLTSDDGLVWELRDEGMLKLFFSDLLPEMRIENISAMRALYQRKHDQLSTLETKSAEMPTGPRLTLELGLGLTSWLIEWCEATERRLSNDHPKPTEA